ncbi:MAG: polysaccharide deacetylase family protein [Phycisphaerales bacterium]|nr:MAG: polysaccharide deacetylase family protein [Phycisphaerales bacterium]
MCSYLKTLLVQLMRWTGLIRLFQFIHRHRIAILMIHGVMDDRDRAAWKPLRSQLAPDKLDAYLKLLGKRYRFVSLADAVQMLAGRQPIQPYCMVLTFDDGYRNNLTHALPILRRYHAPAVFFVPTGFVDKPRPFWFDRLDYALQQAAVDGREVSVGPFRMHLDASGRKALRDSYTRLRRTAKKLQMSDHEFVDEMEQLAAELEGESGRLLRDIQQDDDWSAIMTWEQIEACQDADVTFGSHTVDHMRLDLVEPDTAREQMTKSKQAIEAHTRRDCFCLCYPNGSYSNVTIRLAERCGYRCALTTDVGLNSVGDDLMTLKRVNLPTDGKAADLLVDICGLSTAMSQIKAYMFRCADVA